MAILGTPFAFVILVSALMASTQAEDNDMAVIVNNGNSAQNVTKTQLAKILTGQTVLWPGGRRMIVVLRAAGQPEREGVLRSVCGMSDTEFNRYLMKANFSGETWTPAKALPSAAAVRQLVATTPGAIGFIRMADLNESVKTLKVDGIVAGQPGYKVKAGK